ncbi:MAG: MarR family EPS-associated transcriptional regulator [Proteobacteria bacterium]|nr:MarR family EPS-associated transcriptional regulator [Pseudomonadota bacterium]
MASQRKEKQEEVRLRVMRLISCDADVSSRQVADAVGISNGSAYYILAALVDKGFVKLSNFKKNPHRGSYAYLLTPKGIREKSLLTLHFIKRKRQEFEDLRAEIEALEHEAEFSIGEEPTSAKKSD